MKIVTSTKQNGLLNPLNGSLSLLNGFPTNSESNGLSSNGPTLSSNGCAVSSNGHFTTSNGRLTSSNGHLTSSNGHLTSSNGHIESSNGKLEIRIPKDLLYLPESELKRINCSKLEEVYQWVAYYGMRYKKMRGCILFLNWGLKICGGDVKLNMKRQVFFTLYYIFTLKNKKIMFMSWELLN